MPAELEEIVTEYREKGATIQDEEAEDIQNYCYRKMDVADIKNQEAYLPLLFADELKNYLFRRMVNATTILRMIGETVNV